MSVLDVVAGADLTEIEEAYNEGAKMVDACWKIYNVNFIASLRLLTFSDFSSVYSSKRVRVLQKWLPRPPRIKFG